MNVWLPDIVEVDKFLKYHVYSIAAQKRDSLNRSEADFRMKRTHQDKKCAPACSSQYYMTHLQ